MSSPRPVACSSFRVGAAGRADRRTAGQVTVLAAAVLVLLGLALVGLGHVAAATVDRARAQQAADAAALAAAVRLDPGEVHRVAAVVADHNDAEVVEVRRVGIIVVVTVRSGSARATAAARPAPGTW